MSLFGREGQKVTEMLRGGSAGLAKMAAEANAAGLILSDEQLSSGANFDESFKQLQAVLSGLRNTVGAELAPVFTELFSELKGFLVENMPAIKDFAREFAKELPGHIKALANFFKDLWAAIRPVVSVVQAITSVFGTANTIFAVVVGFIAGKFIFAIYSLIMAFKALGLTIALTPVGWFLLAVMGIAAAAYLIIKHWDPIKKFFSDLWDGALISFMRFSDDVKAGVAKMKGWLPKFMRSEEAKGSAFGVPTDLSQSTAQGFQMGPALGAAKVVDAATKNENIRQEAAVRVSFDNLPTGTRVKTEKAELPLDLNMGYSMVTP